MVQSHDVIRSYHLAGETVPSWFASILALLGIIGSIVTAWLVVPEGLQSNVVVPWISRLDDRYGKNPDLSSNDNDLGLAAGSATGDRELESFSSQFQEAADIASLDIDEIPKRGNRKLESGEKRLMEAEEVGKDKSVAPQEDDCPPLFPFTFRRGSLEPLAPGLNAKITQLNEWLLRHPDVVVVVGGYASSIGADEFNLLLSYRRSKAVYELLTKAGISSEQLVPRAFGEQVTLAGEPSSSGKNRRVSMHVDGSTDCQQNSADGSAH